DPRLIDLKRAAESQTYCDEIKGQANEQGVQITELSTHLQGQLLAVHPAYDELFDGFAPTELRGKPAERTAW
ncbi:sugar phosphate isomerase/epimerase, partial [Roseateles sp. GG27B]